MEEVVVVVVDKAGTAKAVVVQPVVVDPVVVDPMVIKATVTKAMDTKEMVLKVMAIKPGVRVHRLLLLADRIVVNAQHQMAPTISSEKTVFLYNKKLPQIVPNKNLLPIVQTHPRRVTNHPQKVQMVHRRRRKPQHKEILPTRSSSQRRVVIHKRILSLNRFTGASESSFK